MIQQEAIKLKTNRRGTFIKYFTTYSGQTSEDSSVSFLIAGINNSPIKIVESYLDTQIYRNSNNNFEPLSGVVIYTGTTIRQTSEFLSLEQKDTIKNNYISLINAQYMASTSGVTTAPFSYVHFEDAELEDMYINISFQRTVDVLDTLNVYNIPINSTTTRESTTGVLFGKLEAIQNILNENGEKIRIPLKNTPVAIFNPSEEFPSIGLNNEEDNRITLNLKENINIGTYFNSQSEKTDLKYLTDTSQFKGIPDKYKYSSVTNELGEFIIYDVPTGEQTFMYEVNLLKHGLTADEVALNFFPYPTEDAPKVDKVPHYFFRQLPINIVPAWGDFQTGYTELNVAVSLDLRKWCTYYVSPIAYKNKNLEELFGEGIQSRLTIGVRDMTKKIEKDRAQVEIVEVADIYNRNFNQVTEWGGEFKQKKNKAEFFRTAFNVFKLPANLYDPNGIGSDGKAGVWLCAYQFKMYYSDETNIYRATGYEREWLPNFGPIGRSHYSLNRNSDTGVATNEPEGKLGVFPYEKPWTINYPEPYNIPGPPKMLNPNKQFQNGDPIVPTEPLYLDGDQAGWDTNSWQPITGYGFQNIGGSLNPNQFSREVTKHYVYKYESGVNWHDQYSNGYQPIFPQTFSPYGTYSNVKNGERWQRLEAGYAYWLRPEGWPRIINHEWGDSLVESDYVKPGPYGPFTPALFSPSSYSGNIYKLRENILLRMDSGVGYLRTGSLDIYRIGKPNVVVEQLPPPIEKFVKINLQQLIFKGSRPDDPVWFEVGSQNDEQMNELQIGTIKIRNLGTTKVTITVGAIMHEIEPGEEKEFKDQINNRSTFILPANNSFDSETNSYLTAKYEFILWSIINDVNQGGPHDPGTGDVCYGGLIRTKEIGTTYNGLAAGTEENIPEYYLVQIVPSWVILQLGTGGANSSTVAPYRIAFNGFAFMTWKSASDFLFASSEWVTSYWDGGPKPTLNPITMLLPQPLPTQSPFGGNIPFALI